jgi:hypothetical protein
MAGTRFRLIAPVHSMGKGASFRQPRKEEPIAPTGYSILILTPFCQDINAFGFAMGTLFAKGMGGCSQRDEEMGWLAPTPVVIASPQRRTKQSRFVPRAMQPDCRASLRSLAMTRRGEMTTKCNKGTPHLFSLI